jgi:hypothetical protein
MQDETAKRIVGGSELLEKLASTVFLLNKEGIPTGIGAMREKVAQDNKERANTGWDGIREEFVSPRLRKRALAYMCLEASISPTEAIAIVQTQIARGCIKGEDAPQTVA